MKNEVKQANIDPKNDGYTPWGLYGIVIFSTLIMIGIIIQAYMENHK